MLIYLSMSCRNSKTRWWKGVKGLRVTWGSPVILTELPGCWLVRAGQRAAWPGLLTTKTAGVIRFLNQPELYLSLGAWHWHTHGQNQSRVILWIHFKRLDQIIRFSDIMCSGFTLTKSTLIGLNVVYMLVSFIIIGVAAHSKYIISLSS